MKFLLEGRLLSDVFTLNENLNQEYPQYNWLLLDQTKPIQSFEKYSGIVTS